MNVTTNAARQLFVIEFNGGFTTYGFENCFKDSYQLAKKLGMPDMLPNLSEIGTIKQYENYQRLTKSIGGRDLGTWFTPGTKPEVIQALSKAMDEKWNVRIWYGDENGKSWMDEYDMTGRVARSTGSLKVPLLIEGNKNHGGAILTDCIIKVSRIVSGSKSRMEEIWTHPKFNLPKMELVKSDLKEYVANVNVDGKVYARFKSMEKAQKWVDFMKGLVPKP